MDILSSAFENNGVMPERYTCDGENINPPLEFLNAPDEAESLALIVTDPDAPMGEWVHWIVWNIDPLTQFTPEKSIPDDGIEGKTSFGRIGYGGPCPPNGVHHYVFTLFALDTTIELQTIAGKNELLAAMEGHVIDQAELVGKYSRK